VMVETAFAQLERGGDVVHGGGVVSLLLKETRSGAQDFLTRFRPGFVPLVEGGFAKHHRDGIAEYGFARYWPRKG